MNPPRATAEQTLLGNLLCFPAEAIPLTESLSATDFCDEGHRKIFAAILEHHAKGLPVEIPALADTLRNPALVSYTIGLMDSATVAATTPHYISEVLKSSRERQISALGAELRHHPERAGEIVDKIQALQQPAEDHKTRSLFASASDLLDEPIAYRRLVGRLIERGCTGQLFGPSGDGKTFVALDMALGIATGGLWGGIQCEQGLILYFAGEGHHGLKRRIRAWSRHHGNRDLPRLHVSRSTISFDVASIRQVTVEAGALEETTGEKVAFIVIDTLARHLEGDENSTRDMSEFIRAVDGLRSAFPDSTALIIHHSGNGPENANRSRGSSALKAAMDFEIQCTKGLLTFTKVKDGAAPEPIEFKLVPVEIGTDEDGEPVTSCVVQYGERSLKQREASMTANERLLYDLINESPGHVDTLRATFYERRREDDPTAKQDTLKKSFGRTLESLLKMKTISQDGNIIQGAGHGTKRDIAGQVPDRDTGHSGTPLKGCVPYVPLVPSCSPHDVPSLTESDFEGVTP